MWSALTDIAGYLGVPMNAYLQLLDRFPIRVAQAFLHPETIEDLVALYEPDDSTNP
jgi:hypothetical protein